MPCGECFNDGCSAITCPCDCHDEEARDRAVIVQATPMPLAKFYAVRNDKGQYYRTYSRRSSPAGWEDKLEDASVYSRVGPARGLATRLCKRKTIVVVELVVTQVNVIAREVKKKGKH